MLMGQGWAGLAEDGASNGNQPRRRDAIMTQPQAPATPVSPARAGNDEPFAPDPDVFLRNMAALWRRDVQLAQRIDDLPVDAGVPVERTKNGRATATALTPDGRRIYLHSRYDPVTEAQRFVSGLELDGTFCFVVGGFGLGYHVRELFDRLKGDAFVLVTESNLALIKTALETVELEAMVGSDRCVILTDTNPAVLHEKLNRLNTTMMLGARFVAHGPSEQTQGAFQSEIRSHLTDYFAFCRMSLVTLAANSRITCRNVANNLPTYVATPGIGSLHQRFKGVPAILVAAGPSARKNLSQLHEARSSAVIIAVQTMYKTLLEMGLAPDFVTSLDYHAISKMFFEGTSDVNSTCMVAEPKASWHTLDAFGGPVRLLDNPFARMCLGDKLGRREGLKAGSTVAHLAFYLAEYMGCDPIILTGQDLGFSGGVYYTPGVSVHALWRPELNRFQTLEMMEWERIVRARKILRPTTDIHGQRIYTDDQMFTYLQQFESDFAATRATVIDATEGGVRKRGTDVMTLAQAVERFCTKPIPESLRRVEQEASGQARQRQQRGREEIRRRREEVDAFVDLCTEVLRILDVLVGLVDRPVAFNRELPRLDELRVEVQRHNRVCQMASAVSQLAELRRFNADRRMDVSDESSRQRVQRQLTRDVEFISSLKEGADALAEILDEAIARFDAAIDG